MSAPKLATAEAAYTVAEAAALKRVSQDTILKAIRRTSGNALRAKKVGRGYRIPASSLEAWFDGLDDA